MTEPVKIPVQIKYDGTGFKQLSRDAQQAEREALRATRAQITAQRNLSRLTANLDRGLAKDQAAADKTRQPTLAQQVGGQFVAANALTGITAGVKQFVADSIEGAAAAERLGTATENMGRRFGVSGEQIVKSIQDASMHTVNQLDAMQMANRAMLLGIVDSEKEFAELAQIGIVLGRAMGQDAKKSIDDITTGLGRQSPLILDNLGLIVDVEKANRDYARSLGISVNSLTEAQKAEAFKQETLKQGRAMVAELGDVTLDTAGKVEQLTAKWQDFGVEFGQAILAIGDGSGALDTMSGWLDRLSEGAKGWQTAGQSAEVLRRGMEILNKEGESTLGWLEEIPVAGGAIRGLDFWGSQIFRAEEFGAAMQKAGDEVWGTSNALDTNTSTVEDNTAALEANEETLKRLERARQTQVDTLLSINDIEARAAEDSAQAWQDWSEDVSKLNSDTWKNIEKAQATSAQNQRKIQKDLQKDLAKDLEKLRKDNAKRDRRAAEDAARAEKRDRRVAQVDAMADERLFQFELRQMGAEGDAIGIQQALERRAIEQEIAREKSATEAQFEDEDRRVQQQRQREDDAERVRELREAAAERKAEIETAAAEALAAEKAALEETIAAENESFDARKASLESALDERLAAIESGSQEAIQVLAEELVRAGELTEEELGKLTTAAGRIGKEVGAAFAYGIRQGTKDVSEAEGFLGLGGGGDGAMATAGGQGSETMMQRDIPGFALGGVVPGPIGAPTLAVVHGGETITPPGQAGDGVTFVLNNPTFGNVVSKDEIMVYFRDFAREIVKPALRR